MKTKGFTIVELIIVITIIAILATIGTLSFASVQKDTRDSQRNSSATVLVEGLERYYDKNGEYPSCPSMTGSPVALGQTLGLDSVVLKAPKGVTDNSVICSDISAATTTDVFAYVGDGTSQCTSGLACLSWTLKYKEEGTGTIKTISSRRTALIVLPSDAATPSMSATISGPNAIGTGAPTTCAVGNPSYRLSSQENGGAWSTGVWSSATDLTVAAAQGSQYGFQVEERCGLPDGSFGAVATSPMASAVRGIDTPGAPIVTAASTGTGSVDSVAWSWAEVSCPAGTAAEYLSAYSRDDATGWRAWSTVAVTTTNQAQATNYQGYEYKVKAKARCKTAYTASSYSGESNAPAYIRKVETPGIASNFQKFTRDGVSGGVTMRYLYLKWTQPTCGLGTTQRFNANAGMGMVTTGEGGYSPIFSDVQQSDVDSINKVRDRWLAASIPTSNIAWSASDAWRTALQPTNPSYNNTGPSLTYASYDNYSTPEHWVYGWGPADSHAAAAARVLVFYACRNDDTKRQSIWGDYTISPIL